MFHNILWKNPNELFGQPNILHFNKISRIQILPHDLNSYVNGEGEPSQMYILKSLSRESTL